MSLNTYIDAISSVYNIEQINITKQTENIKVFNKKNTI